MTINPMPQDTILHHLREQDPTPVEHPPATGENLALWDEHTWDVTEARAAKTRSHLATARMEIRSYHALVGQSQRDDYHKAYADLYGMQPIPTHTENWSNSYTTKAKLLYALNHVEDVHKGLTQTYRKEVVLTWAPHTFQIFKTVPVKTVRQCLLAVSVALTGYPGALADVPPWRIDEKGNCLVLATVTQDRPAEVRYVEANQPLPPLWRNPHQIEDGFTFLADSPNRGFTEPGAEGLCILIDHTKRMHLVYWDTVKPAPNAKRTRKRPLAIHSLTLDTTVEEALREMHAVSAAMTRTLRVGETTGLLPWQAARMQDADESVSVDTITGSNEWLQAVMDQRESGEAYRPHGAEAAD